MITRRLLALLNSLGVSNHGREVYSYFVNQLIEWSEC